MTNYTINGNIITNIELTADPNHREQYRLWIDVQGDLDHIRWPEPAFVKKARGYNYFCGIEDGLCDYYVTKDFDLEHRPGYRWSSRAGVFNKDVLPKELHIIDCAINSVSCGITVEKAKTLLPVGYTIILDENNDEPKYIIVKDE